MRCRTQIGGQAGHVTLDAKRVSQLTEQQCQRDQPHLDQGGVLAPDILRQHAERKAHQRAGRACATARFSTVMPTPAGVVTFFVRAGPTVGDVARAAPAWAARAAGPQPRYGGA